MRGIKAKMNRLIFTRRLYDPKPQDNTEYEISLDQVKMLCAAYGRANTKEAAVRKLCLKSLWRAAGRAGEPQFLSYEGFRWNTTFDTPTTESPQSKPSKLKYIFQRQTTPPQPSPPPPSPPSPPSPETWSIKLFQVIRGTQVPHFSLGKAAAAAATAALALALALAAPPGLLDRGGTEYNSDEKTWLLPELQGGSAATKMSGYIKAMQVTPCPCS